MHGSQHTAINLSATALAAFPLALSGRPITAAAFTAGMLFGTLLVTPDLDLKLNDARRRWGRLRFIWTPYATFSRHRGASHTYLLGPTVRLAYLLLWLCPIIALCQGAIRTFIADLAPEVIVITAAGYYAAQWLHLVCDGILPFNSRGRRAR